MAKIIQIILLLFVFAIVGSIPILLGNAFQSTPPSQVQLTVNAQAPVGAVTAQLTGGVQEISIRASPNGYNPLAFTVKKGVPVKILFSADKYAGCGRQFTIRELGINALAEGDKPIEIQFTPMQEGSFAYRCSMNMFRGVMTVTA